jgi:hypothetical protein
MLTIRAVAAMSAIFVAALVVGTPAHASCDSIYSGSCKPIPAKEAPEPAAEPEKTSKPLQINRRHAARKAARSQRTAQTPRKRYARGTTTETVLVLRKRRAKALASAPRERAKAAPIVAEDDAAPAPPRRSLRAPRRHLATADLNAPNGDATDGAAATDVLRPHSVATVPVATPVAAGAEQARPAPPVAAPAPAVRTVAQSEVNEIDLAAAAATPDPADQSWMRTLVLAFGGVLAAGTALRLFL